MGPLYCIVLLRAVAVHTRLGCSRCQKRCVSCKIVVFRLMWRGSYEVSASSLCLTHVFLKEAIAGIGVRSCCVACAQNANTSFASRDLADSQMPLPSEQRVMHKFWNLKSD